MEGGIGRVGRLGRVRDPKGEEQNTRIVEQVGPGPVILTPPAGLVTARRPDKVTAKERAAASETDGRLGRLTRRKLETVEDERVEMAAARVAATAVQT